ncbi:hypothetical protein FN846DRAFT_912621 [Sphaerosporella brunnea]|uniref:Uncharacterized protein n=1 Tax=Sphaerosporella brunnea TaxID=1250544 RepID=A0A5J5EI62_9PEZI|nr:hypothetical protein FN846DRAFT_912621 [Sphaerosporella brunnea]
MPITTPTGQLISLIALIVNIGVFVGLGYLFGRFPSKERRSHDENNQGAAPDSPGMGLTAPSAALIWAAVLSMAVWQLGKSRFRRMVHCGDENYGDAENGGDAEDDGGAALMIEV